MIQWRKIPLLIKTNYKHMASNYLVIVSFIVFSLLLAFVCSGLIKEYEDKSSIPVGIIDEDKSQLSKEVIQNLSSLDGIFLQSGTKEELEAKLKDEQIYAYFIVNQGFEKSISSYQFSKLVNMVYLGQNQFVNTLSDIFAQAMIKDIVVSAGEQMYQTFPDYEDLLYQTDYQEFIKNEYEESEDSFAFNYQFYNVSEGGAEKSAAVRNNLISAEIFLALGAIYLCFFIMQLIACMEKNPAIVRRTRLALSNRSTIELSDILTLFISECAVAAMTLWFLFQQLHIQTGAETLKLIGVVAACLLTLTVLFLILRYIIKSKTLYQFIGFVVILILGGSSILQMLGQIRVEWLTELVKKIPNYWFIGGITDIILGVKTIHFTDFAVTIVLLLVIYCGCTLLKYKNLER